jgi:hypothetical protein
MTCMGGLLAADRRCAQVDCISFSQPRPREADTPSESHTDFQPASPCLGQACRRMGRRLEYEGRTHVA